MCLHEEKKLLTQEFKLLFCAYEDISAPYTSKVRPDSDRIDFFLLLLVKNFAILNGTIDGTSTERSNEVVYGELLQCTLGVNYHKQISKQKKPPEKCKQNYFDKDKIQSLANLRASNNAVLGALQTPYVYKYNVQYNVFICSTTL